MTTDRDTARHRPASPELLAREARDLLMLGLSVVDAAQLLEITPQALADLLDLSPTTTTTEIDP